MIAVRYVQREDKDFWFKLDKHLSEEEFKDKILRKRGYVLLDKDEPIGLLRYNLFWDSIPFCTMIFIEHNQQRKGYGRKLMQYWEDDMRRKGYRMLMTSTRTDEQAQHFYRNLGYKECGCLILDTPPYEQPMELFLSKNI